MNRKHNFSIRGIVTLKLTDKDGNPRKVFKENKLWAFLNSVLNKDVRIPFLTGTWSYNPVVFNNVTPAGFASIANFIIGAAEDPFKHLAIGTGLATAAGLASEITTNGGARAQATVSRVTLNETNDTSQWVYEWTFTGDLAITEEGIFSGTTAGVPGTMLAYKNFPVINVEDGNKLEITHQVQVKEEAGE